MRNHLEELPNELLWLILEYIPIIDLFRTFFNQNQRFNQILCSMHFRLNFFFVPQHDFNYFLTRILPNIEWHGIESLFIDDIPSRLISMKICQNLRALTVRHVHTENLRLFSTFERLEYLNLHSELILAEDDVNALTSVIFSGLMPSLTLCHLAFDDFGQMTFDHLDRTKKALSLRTLIIDQWCRLRDFIQLLNFIPNIRRLTVRLFDSESTGKIPPSLKSIDDFTNLVPHLVYLRAKLSRISFSTAREILFDRLPSRLQELSLSTWSTTYADGQAWRTILSSKFPRLKHFCLIISLDRIPSSYSTTRTADLDHLVKSFNQSTYFLDNRWHALINVHERDRLKLVLHTVPYPIENFQSTLYNIRRSSAAPSTIKSTYSNVKKLSLVLHDETNASFSDQNEYRCFPSVDQLIFLSNLPITCQQFQSIEYYNDLKRMIDLSRITSLDFPEGSHHYPILFIDTLLKNLPTLQCLTLSYGLYAHLNTDIVPMLKRLTFLFAIYSSVLPPATRMGHLTPSNQILTNDLIVELVRTLRTSFPALQILTLLIISAFDSGRMFFERTFPDEIILEICRYLHPTDILLSFSGLNQRFNRTISYFLRHLQFSSLLSSRVYLYLLQNVLPSIWSTIQSLHIDNSSIPCLGTLFLNHVEDLPPNLKKLTLLQVTTKEIHQFVIRLMEQSSVEELIIECTDQDFVRQQQLYGFAIAQMLFFHHPTLKTIELRGDLIFDVNHLSFLSLSNGHDVQSLNKSFVLRRLTVSLQSLNTLHLLLMHQPNLDYLNVHLANRSSNTSQTIMPFAPLLNLREFHFRIDDWTIQFQDVFELLTYFPHLNSFSLDLMTNCRSFFDGDMLQTLVHSLETFHFSIARRSAPTAEELSLSTFHSPFWLEGKKWSTQCYWHIGEDYENNDYFHIYSVPFVFSTFNVNQCTDENSTSNDRSKPFVRVKRLDLSEASDVNIEPFLQLCPNVRTISLKNIYDDEENYGTDEEEDITDQIDQDTFEEPVSRKSKTLELCFSLSDLSVSNIQSMKLSLPELPHVQHLILLGLPGHDLDFFKRLVAVTPNLRRLTIHFDHLLELFYIPLDPLYLRLRQSIVELEIHLDYYWSFLDISRDIPRILRLFSHTKSLTISLHETQKRPAITAKELLIHLLKHQTKLICINILTNSPKDLQFEEIETWLRCQWPRKDATEVHLNTSSMTIWS